MQVFLEFWPLILLFFTVAILYASVGFGGGSSYLALLALFGLPFPMLRPLALICNITVVSYGTWQYHKHKMLDARQLLPLVMASVPFAFIGGTIGLEEHVFFVLLGLLLLVASLLMWFNDEYKRISLPYAIDLKTSTLFNFLVGGVIGFVSGLVGIGGGIFLAPILYLLQWDKPSKIAAAASFFILINSISGFVGQYRYMQMELDYSLALYLILAVASGGGLGNFLGRKKFSPLLVKRATAVLVFYVGVSILYKNLL